MSPENYEKAEMLYYSPPASYGSPFQLQSSKYIHYFK